MQYYYLLMTIYFKKSFQVLRDQDYLDITQSSDGLMITSLIKYFFKHLSKPILKSQLFDDKLKDEFFKDKLTLNELGIKNKLILFLLSFTKFVIFIDDEMFGILQEMINDLEDKAKDILLYFIFHLQEYVFIR